MKPAKIALICCLACILLSGCIPNQSPTSVLPSPTSQAEEESALSPFAGMTLDVFYDASWRMLTLRYPETVLIYGLKETYGMTDVSLDNISDEYQQETYQLLAEILDTLRRYDRESLSHEEQITYDIYEWYLKVQLEGEKYRYHDYPATYYATTAVQEGLIRFFRDLHPVESYQDAQDYITRLILVRIKIDQLLDGLRLREEAGIQPPAFAVQWEIYGNLGKIVSQPAVKTPFYTAFQEKVTSLTDVSEIDKQTLLNEAEKAVEEVVLPAYQRLYDFMTGMEAYSQADSGVWRLPEGEAYYSYLLHLYTSTELTASEIHQLGLQELERIHAEMDVIFDELGYPENESLEVRYNRVAVDGGVVTGKDVLTTYEDIIHQAEKDTAAAFDIQPRSNVIVVPDPYGDFYIIGSIDGSRPGMFYAGVNEPGEAYYGMPTLAYHEAIPGHHFQMSITQELQNVPAFRTANLFLAEIEGWALYAERLAWELGWYEGDPYGELGYLQAQAVRATRLVVDTGLHTQRWTFEQAQQFFTENTGYGKGDSLDPQQQIGRYLVWPGQATAYTIGYLKLMDLRQRAMDELDNQFELKEFHRVVLMNGGMPLEILERVIDDYIAEK